MTKLIRPAIYIAECVDPSPAGDISDLLAIVETDQTLTITILGHTYPIITLDAQDLAALTSLLNQGAEPMNTRRACTQALELLDNIDDLLESIFPTPEYHNQGQTAEAKLSAARNLIYTRLSTIEDSIAAQSPIPSRQSPIPSSPHNATLSQQEPTQT